MAGLKRRLNQLTSQKSELSKIRRRGENEYKKVKSLSRKYSSSLKSTEKRIENFKQSADEINDILSQKIAQMESVQRLKTAAQERLNLELQNKEQKVINDLTGKYGAGSLNIENGEFIAS